MKRIITVLSFTFLSVGLFAQDKINIGIEGGGGLSYLRGDKYVEQGDFLVGMSSGITFQYHFTKKISIKTGLSYDRKGYEYNIITTDPSDFYSQSKQYFEYSNLPLLIRATFGKKIKYFINSGPYLGYLTREYIYYFDDVLPEKRVYNYETKSNRLDFGISTGIGLQVPIKNKIAISVELRNNQGFYNISPITTLMTSSTNILLGVNYILK